MLLYRIVNAKKFKQTGWRALSRWLLQPSLLVWESISTMYALLSTTLCPNPLKVMCRSVVGPVAIKKKQNAYFTTTTKIEKDKTFLLWVIHLHLVEERRKICLLFTLFLSTVRNLSLVEDSCNFSFLVNSLIRQAVTKCAIIVGLAS